MARVSRKRKSEVSSTTKYISNCYKTALYIRLSNEESESEPTQKIKNQKELLLNYISNKPEYQLVGIYCDNGCTGTNFDRPQWKCLINDIKSKKVNCIIVKDLSRLGRNYIECGNYIEKIFPFLGVRFLAINDNYDSSRKNTEDIQIMLSIKNIVNTSYARNLSRKIQNARHIQRNRGEFTGSQVPFGYKKDIKQKGKLIIDKKTAPIVKMIFKQIAVGCSYSEIARKLNDLKIPSPRGKLWSYQSIKMITGNEVYIGRMKQGIRCILESDIIIKENSHKAIIDKTTFNKVMMQRKKISIQHKKRKIQEDDYLFQGLLIAANSKKKMYKIHYYKQNGKVLIKAYRSPKIYSIIEKQYKTFMIREEVLLLSLEKIFYYYFSILNVINFLENLCTAYLRKFEKEKDITKEILKLLVEKIIVFSSNKIEIKFIFKDEF